MVVASRQALPAALLSERLDEHLEAIQDALEAEAARVTLAGFGPVPEPVAAAEPVLVDA